MSTENDVPLGDESRRYYEQQFGDRIRQVKKGGSAPRSDRGGGGGSNFNGRAGCGLAVGAFVILRIIVALVSSGSRTTTTYDKPVPPVVFDGDLREKADAFRGQQQVDQERLQEALRQFQKQNQPLEIELPGAAAEADALLTADDVPFLQGLCYRIYQQGVRPDATLGKKLFTLLDPGSRLLLVKSAQGKVLTQEEGEELLDGLNEALQHADLWNPDGPPLHRLPERRKMLEQCFPRQIVPMNERDKWKGEAREVWLRQARLDLVEARKQYEPGKR